MGRTTSLLRHLRWEALRAPEADLTDGQLLECFLERREETAFALLLRRHGPMVLGVCRRVLGNVHDAEDACQATFLVLVRRANRVRRRESLGAWLHGVAYRTAVHARADRARRRAREGRLRDVVSPPVSPDDSWQEVRMLLDRALDRLPERYRVPVILCHLEGRPRKEVAHLLRVPEGTLSSRLAAARQLLARRLAGSGLAITGAALGLILAREAPAAVPAPLAVSTLRAAAHVAAGRAAAGIVSARVASLMEGGATAMFLTRCRVVALAVAAGALLAGAGVVLCQVPAERAAARDQGQPPAPAVPEKVGEVRRFEGHPDWVYTVALSPDGKRALSGSSSVNDADGVVRLWDVAAGKERSQLEGHTAGVMGVAFSPDGKRGLSGSDDQTARLWDLDTGKEVRRFEGHTDQVWAVAYAPDGKGVATGSRDQTIRLWDAETGKELKRFEGHTDGLLALAFAPDGRRLLSGSFDATVRLWDVAAGKEVRTFAGHTDGVQSVAFAPDGTRAVSAGLDGTIRVWDVEGGGEVLNLDGHALAVTSVAFTPDGRRLLSGSWDRTVRLWDLESGEVVHGFFGHKAEVQAVAVSRDGRYALSGSRDQTVRLWRLPR
jgi:RNA polymerase sigma factor (sigma-70 family)